MKIQVATGIVLLIALLSAAIEAGSSKEDRKHFREWCKKHNKSYRSLEEEKTALENFLVHKKTVDEHNKLFNEGKKSFSMGLSEHHDLTMDEIRETRLGVKVPEEHSKREKRANIPTFKTGPKSVDWREKGLVGPVESQAGCSSCYAFSTTAIVYAVTAKKNKTVQTSESQIVDCDPDVGGCSGGWPEYALNYIKENGIASEKEYPYHDYVGTCDYTKNESVATVSKVHSIPTNGNETLLRDIVGTVGPVSIVFCVEDDFSYYQGSVYKHDNCCMKKNHAPVIVGYGTDEKEGDYWLVKNSWGVGWGINGFAKIARNYPKENGNMCNIAHYAVYAE